jgi:antitoxin component of MazEF toxin-antitoxin module
MIECEATVKKWGNSVGIIIPKDVVATRGIRENSRVRFAILDGSNSVVKTFGLLKQWKEPTSKILRQMRKESWND